MSVVLSEHLPLLASAPDGIQKLRSLILELAVRGKLVPQDPNDEPASELLTRIAKERARLEAEGVCKKAKVTSIVGEDEQPFALPVGWQWVRFSSYALDISTGPFGSMLHQSDYRSGGIPLVNPSHMIGGRIVPEAHIAVEEVKAEELSSYRLRCGDIVMARRGEVGRTAFVTEKENGWLCGTGSFVIRLGLDVSRQFVVMLFRASSIRRYLSDEAVGTTMVNLNHSILNSMPVALPPLAEQHRIVAKVDELMALCERLEAEQADAASAHARLVETLLGTLTQSTDAADLAANWQRLAEHFDTLFATEASIDTLKQTVLQLSVMGKLVPQDPKDEPASELLKRIAQERAQLEAEGVCKKSKAMPLVKEDVQAFAIPDTWQWTSLGGVSVTSTGKTPATSKAEYYGGALPFIGPGQLTPAGGILPPEKWLSDVGRTETTLAKAGDILMVCIGGSIGKAAIAKTEIAFNQQINCARPILISSKYLYSGMTAQYFQKAVLAKATGSATPIINRSNWDEIALPIPPLGEQHRIVAKVDELMALCDHLKADLVTARQKQATLADTLIESALEAA